MTKAIVCAYADYSATALDWAALSQDEVAELSADLLANSQRGVVDVPCQSAQVRILLVQNEYGDVVALQKYCDFILVTEQVWEPTKATLDMLEAALQ